MRRETTCTVGITFSYNSALSKALVTMYGLCACITSYFDFDTSQLKENANELCDEFADDVCKKHRRGIKKGRTPYGLCEVK